MVVPNEAERKDAYLKWSQMVAKAWSDPAFKARLLANPEEVLKEQEVPGFISLGEIKPAAPAVKAEEETVAGD